MSSLAGVIAKVRTDFGYEIEIEKPEELFSRRKREGPIVAFGRIHYDLDREHDGLFLYLRPGTSGSEDIPLDVIAFSKAHPQFPFDPTVNQWFKESRFESYRMLGYILAKELFKRVKGRTGVDGLCAQLEALTRLLLTEGKLDSAEA